MKKMESFKTFVFILLYKFGLPVSLIICSLIVEKDLSIHTAKKKRLVCARTSVLSIKQIHFGILLRPLHNAKK